MKTRSIAMSLIAMACLLLAMQATAMTEKEARGLLQAASNNGNQAALSRLQQAAQSGDRVAEDYLGTYYSVGKNYTQANFWFQKSAEQGYADGENNLGNVYEGGSGVPLDYAQANFWHQKAADQGLAEAESNLGAAYYNGEGLQQNYPAAVYWFQKAADQGSPGGEYNLGNAYYEGNGESKNYEWAAYWWQKAAQNGSTEGEFALRNTNQFGPRLVITNSSNQTITGVFLCTWDGGCTNNNLLEEGGESDMIPPGVYDNIGIRMPPLDYSTEAGTYYVTIETPGTAVNHFYYFKNVVLNAYKVSNFTFR